MGALKRRRFVTRAHRRATGTAGRKVSAMTRTVRDKGSWHAWRSFHRSAPIPSPVMAPYSPPPFKTTGSRRSSFSPVAGADSTKTEVDTYIHRRCRHSGISKPRPVASSTVLLTEILKAGGMDWGNVANVCTTFHNFGGRSGRIGTFGGSPPCGRPVVFRAVVPQRRLPRNISTLLFISGLYREEFLIEIEAIAVLTHSRARIRQHTGGHFDRTLGVAFFKADTSSQRCSG